LDTKYPGLKDNERLAVIALRNIQADEEITLDYNLFGYDMPG
jgi:SET domain-containing protein